MRHSWDGWLFFPRRDKALKCPFFQIEIKISLRKTSLLTLTLSETICNEVELRCQTPIAHKIFGGQPECSFFVAFQGSCSVSCWKIFSGSFFVRHWWCYWLSCCKLKFLLAQDFCLSFWTTLKSGTRPKHALLWTRSFSWPFLKINGRVFFKNLTKRLGFQVS